MSKTKKYISRRSNKKGGEKTPTENHDGIRRRKVVKAKMDPNYNPFPQTKKNVSYIDDRKVKAKFADSIQFPETDKPDIFQRAKEAREADESWERAMKGDNMEPWFAKGVSKSRKHRKSRKSRKHRKSRKSRKHRKSRKSRKH
jgi:hypothetical protein